MYVTGVYGGRYNPSTIISCYPTTQPPKIIYRISRAIAEGYSPRSSLFEERRGVVEGPHTYVIIRYFIITRIYCVINFHQIYDFVPGMFDGGRALAQTEKYYTKSTRITNRKPALRDIYDRSGL